VRFVTWECQDRNPVRIENLGDAVHSAIEIGLKLLSQLLARRLVCRVTLVSERQARIMDPAEVIRSMIGHEEPKKIRDAPAGGSILALAHGQWSRNQREKSAINESVAIDKKQSWTVWAIHKVNIKQ